jgi:hypothetical protein
VDREERQKQFMKCGGEAEGGTEKGEGEEGICLVVEQGGRGGGVAEDGGEVKWRGVKCDDGRRERREREVEIANSIKGEGVRFFFCFVFSTFLPSLFFFFFLFVLLLL